VSVSISGQEVSVKIRDIMTQDVKTVLPSDTIEKAARWMDELNVGVLPVIDGEKLVGMITDRDITVRATSVGKNPTECQVGEIMTTEVRVCFDDDNVEEAAQRMRVAQIRRLPVVNRDGQFIGIVSLGDLATGSDRQSTIALTLDRISTPSEPDRSGP
jgi:CBS domain-containing protein